MSGDSPQDAVRSAAAMGETLQGQLNTARRAPEKELGFSAEELAQRKREAMKTRRVPGAGDTGKAFEVRSSARAQQIMSAGLAERQRTKRQRELKNTMGILRRFQYVLSFFGVLLLGWLGQQFLLPQYRAVQERNRLMEYRYQRTQERLREAGQDPEAEAEALQRAFVRVVRLDEQGNVIGELSEKELKEEREKSKKDKNAEGGGGGGGGGDSAAAAATAEKPKKRWYAIF